MIAAGYIYLAGFIIIYYSIFIGAVSKYYGRFFLLFSIMLLGAVAVLRGAVGTDTAMY